MNVQITKESSVTRPSTTPMGSSILDHAEAAGHLITMQGDFGLRSESGLWPSYNCKGPGQSTPFECVDEDGPVREFGFGQWIPAFAFGVEDGVQCKALGLDKADMEAEILRTFEMNEGKSVERALLDIRFLSPADSDADPLWEPTVDVTPGTPISLAVGLALLEGYAAANYVGIPTIHMPRAAASLLNERLVWRDGLAFTRLGSRVAVGGGYDVDLEDGVWEMYVTGEVYIERSQVVSHNVYVLPGDGSGLGSDQNGISDNTVLATADRLYRVGVDCFVAKVSGTVWS